MNPLRLDPYENKSQQVRNHYDETLRFLRGRVNSNQSIIDIGQRSPLTDIMEADLNIKITNTTGDLDQGFEFESTDPADVIIYSHTIEHQFNPLYTLLRIKEKMQPDGVLYIMLPSRGRLLWTAGHFHEIDHYRMGLLIKRAGLKIVGYERRKHWRGIRDYFTGFRMMLRAIFEYNAYYTCTK